MRRAGVLTIIGALLPLALGATLGMTTTDTGKGTLAYPMPPEAFLALSVGLAVAHLLVLAGYLAVARTLSGWVRSLAQVAAAGTAAVAGVEIWAGLLATADRGSTAVAVLDASYGAAAVLISVGTVGVAVGIWSRNRRLALPLLLNGLLLGLVVVPLRFAGSDGLAIAMLTLWGTTYAWLGWVLARSASPHAGRTRNDGQDVPATVVE
jgi:hypothetical protein